MTEPTAPPTAISVGRLLAMTEHDRDHVIRNLSLDVRRRLAHLASLGAGTVAAKVAAEIDAGRYIWMTERLEYIRSHADLAAQLTGDNS